MEEMDPGPEDSAGMCPVSLQTEGLIPPASGSAVGRWPPAVGSLRSGL